MRIAVVGAGAMGSVVSYLLCDRSEIVLFDSRRDRVEEISGRGVRLRGALSGKALIPIESKPRSSSPFDFIVLAVSTVTGAEALRPISPLVHRDTVYVSFQEGSAVEELAKIVGGDRAAACLSAISAAEMEGGEVELEELRSLVLFSYRTEAALRFQPFLEAMIAACGDKIEVAEDVEEAVLGRICAVGPVSALCAITGGVPEEIRGIDEIDLICGEAARECHQVAAGAGEGTMPLSPWDEVVWRWIKPPMLADIEAGRRTEIDYLGGRLISSAAARGTPIPVNKALASMVKEIQVGGTSPGEAALKELRRRIAEERGMSLY